MTRVAIVTGSNKGIGFAVVRGLSKLFDGHVYLTARNIASGEKAVSDLHSELPSSASDKIKFHQLDITDPKSVNNFKEYIQEQYGSLDILVNNAGISSKQCGTEDIGAQAELVNNVNYFGTRRMCDAFFPLLCDNSSLVKEGVHEQHGYPSRVYGFSKAALNALTQVQHRQSTVKGIMINACCPGWVGTDMTNHKGPKTIDQGADTPIYLATLPVDTEQPNGKFVTDRKITEW